MNTQIFKLTGLSCQACQKITEKRINTLPGVARVEVNVASGTAQIESEAPITGQQINEVLKDTPYFIQK